MFTFVIRFHQGTLTEREGTAQLTSLNKILNLSRSWVEYFFSVKNTALTWVQRKLAFRLVFVGGGQLYIAFLFT